ncbi:L-serine ammonia-lyase, iron-sulfur-dependent, subunit beta [Cohnella luojiensis]|uniref:L-serine deaminase n=1 Tax=Cohnella luojiensis TaxID=652876 RepID=A0A4Y8LVW5_9BACL|nr:L-serine ammonia-lyase, iron-sulfur-dependent, subunit beta [Cohnella luojiensis]TFE25178.1 L-serine ammonia-lyase, iron-sulfur-dependent, subunit beta [Cohnella luojiensis]
MRFKDEFSISGLAMIGSPDSHTAGAARLGRAARQLLGGPPDHAVIILCDSFAAIYEGQETNKALVGGVLNYSAEDPRMSSALADAERLGMKVSFERGKGLALHPNTIRLLLQAKDDGRKLILVGTSIGDGHIEVVEVNGFAVKFSCRYPTLVIRHSDQPGMIDDIANVLKNEGSNIGNMILERAGQLGDALLVLELDKPITTRLVANIRRIPYVRQIDWLDLSNTL